MASFFSCCLLGVRPPDAGNIGRPVTQFRRGLVRVAQALPAANPAKVVLGRTPNVAASILTPFFLESSNSVGGDKVTTKT